jgi:hypothetical protein
MWVSHSDGLTASFAIFSDNGAGFLEVPQFPLPILIHKLLDIH